MMKDELYNEFAQKGVKIIIEKDMDKIVYTPMRGG
jgi:hypothetical protein